jgi:hypothetical protein
MSIEGQWLSRLVAEVSMNTETRDCLHFGEKGCSEVPGCVQWVGFREEYTSFKLMKILYIEIIFVSCCYIIVDDIRSGC